MNDNIIVDDIVINFTRVTNKNKACAMLIHGFGSDQNEHGNYIFLANKLLENNIDSIRFDLVGHGKSKGSSEMQTVELGIKIIHHLLQKFTYEKIFLVGSSYGGSISVIYASKYPVQKIVLLSPLLDCEKNVINPENHFCKEFLGNEALKRIKEEGFSNFGINGKKFNYNFYLDAQKYDPKNYIDQIKCNGLVFHGKKDILIPYNQSCDVIKLNKNFKLELIENANHCFYDETFNEIAIKIVEFLKDY